MSLITQLEEQGVESSFLDDLVHDAALKLASSINNGGLKDQVAFLKEQGYANAEILNVVG